MSLMSTDCMFDEVLAAARRVSTTFDKVPDDPVVIRSPSGIGLPEAGEITERYHRHGFAVLELASQPATQETLEALAGDLSLGEPFLPPLYRKGGTTTPVAQISAAANVGSRDENHPSFGRTVGQKLHCDGTLQAIGYIKASMLLCEQPAAEGGETILFNASAAYAKLATADRPAAEALATPGALIRQANINGCADTNAGPAFTVQDERLVAGYSVTETDRWAVPVGVSEADVQRGVGFLLNASLPGSQHFLQFTLSAGQAIVFDNTRISHGRTAYRSSQNHQRRLYRSLHLQHPSLPPEEL
jgi:alpha-ketoglutarate-dependent taurine dioxygenase